MTELPTGTVTFLFTDLEGSTRLWEEHPAAMPEALARHDAIVHESVEAHGGVVFTKMGDGVAAAFASAPDALAAVLVTQQRLASADWGETGALRVRMGLLTDEGRLRTPTEYLNRPLNRCARLMAIGHGGQVLLSEATATIVRHGLPDGAGLTDLGEHRLRDLAQPVRVFQLTHPDLALQFRPLRSLDALPGRLPEQPTEFIGRDDELADLVATLGGTRLVTLTGVGGVGKTRLALQAAAQVVTEYPDGAWLCELGPVVDAAAATGAVAAALDVQALPGQDVSDSLVEALRSKNLLLVLDNCEHVLDEAARLVERIERECPAVTVVATSREGLGLRGERMVAVPSLGLPHPDDDFDAMAQADALRLFVARAVERRPDFELTPESAAAVADLCRRLDGIPLALELAAARVRSMTISEVTERLDQRFRLLTGGSRTALERQQTLRGTVDWSYALLDDAERTLLRRLAVFSGGFDLDAAEAVTAGGEVDRLDVLDLLSQLIDKSLLIAEDDGGTTRYRLLETIRQYAQERLDEEGDTDAVRRRHAEHFVGFAETARPHLLGRDQAAWLERVESEIDNLRAALTWSVATGEADLALRLVLATNINSVRTTSTTLTWAVSAATMTQGTDHPLLADALGWAVWRATWENDLVRGRELLDAMEDAERRLDPPPASIRFQARCSFVHFSGDFDAAVEQSERWVEAARVLGDPADLSAGLTMLGSSYHALADNDRAVETLDESVSVSRELGAPSQLSTSLAMLGLALLERGREDERGQALALLDEAADLAKLVGNVQAVSLVLLVRGDVHRGLGELGASLAAALEAAEAALQFSHPVQVAAAILHASFVLGELGDFESGVLLSAFGAAVLPKPLLPYDLADEAALLARANDSLGEEAVAALRRQGEALDSAGAVERCRAASNALLTP